jgi:hypothetical protein
MIAKQRERIFIVNGHTQTEKHLSALANNPLD